MMRRCCSRSAPRPAWRSRTPGFTRRPAASSAGSRPAPRSPPGCCPARTPAEVLADVSLQALSLSGADLAMLALPDEERRRLTVSYAEGDGADAVRGLVASGRRVDVRAGAGHRRAGDLGRLRRRRARRGGRSRGDEPDRARHRVPARCAGQRPGRAHHRAPPRRAAVSPGAGGRGGLVRRPGRNRARAGRQPGRGGAAVAVRGPGPDRPRPARPGHPAAVRHWHVAGGHHADDHQAGGGQPGHQRGRRDGRDDQGDPRAPSSRCRPGTRPPARICAATSSTWPRR